MFVSYISGLIYHKNSHAMNALAVPESLQITQASKYVRVSWHESIRILKTCSPVKLVKIFEKLPYDQTSFTFLLQTVASCHFLGHTK